MWPGPARAQELIERLLAEESLQVEAAPEVQLCKLVQRFLLENEGRGHRLLQTLGRSSNVAPEALLALIHSPRVLERHKSLGIPKTVLRHFLDRPGTSSAVRTTVRRILGIKGRRATSSS